MNAIIAYLPSGDKKVIIPSAHCYFIISSPCLPRERPFLFVAPTSASCFLITVEEVIMQLCARPSFWGLINPQWSLCTKGRRQSPINIEPDKLLFDRHLRPVHVDKHRVIYLIFQSTKLQSNSVQFCRSVYYNVTFSPRYFYRGTEALYGHLFPLVFNVFPPFSTGHAPRTGMGRGLGACKRPELACDEGIIATSVSLNVDSFYRVSSRLGVRADREAKIRVNITGGPLAYHYQFEEIYIHYGMDDGHGSEHRINNYAFPAEIQVYGFNAELYHNMSEAQHKSQGLVAISLMVQLGETLNPELQIITSVFNKVIYRGDTAPVRYLSLKSLLPDTTGYMTYEGSTTHPGCWETAVWLILNKPIYITARELYALRKLMQGPSSTPKAPLGNNSRPLQGLHYRTVRTNIDFAKVMLRCDYITRYFVQRM
ncbi:Carbonic anhydrase-related protein 10 [Trachymyrmex zeteki]|uniref:Carbonic anhydrase-related protein 10 n=1 Tax=Mycetomoellerius zeteki TaxID=64791 RepID=A0A151WQ74_9HYME|nr:Carbonic anhydrase-related protein 10 [Trachymyrmex zeteki]